MCVIHVNGRHVSGRRYVINVNHAWRGNRSGAILLVSCELVMAEKEEFPRSLQRLQCCGSSKQAR